MEIDLAPFRLPPGEPAALDRRPTRIEPVYDGKADYREALAERVAHISERQRALYAERRSALLVVLQATATSSPG